MQERNVGFFPWCELFFGCLPNQPKTGFFLSWVHSAASECMSQINGMKVSGSVLELLSLSPLREKIFWQRFWTFSSWLDIGTKSKKKKMRGGKLPRSKKKELTSITIVHAIDEREISSKWERRNPRVICEYVSSPLFLATAKITFRAFVGEARFERRKNSGGRN